MRYSYKAFFVILSFILLSLVMLQPRSIHYSLKMIPVNECSEQIKKWVNGHNESKEEIHITKIEKSRKSDEYYIYVSGSIIKSFNAGSDKESINMEISRKEAQFNDRVILISTYNKKAKNIIINGNKINVNQIPKLEISVYGKTGKTGGGSCLA